METRTGRTLREVIENPDFIVEEFLDLVETLAYSLSRREGIRGNRYVDNLISAGHLGLMETASKAAGVDRPYRRLKNFCFSGIRNAMIDEITRLRKHETRTQTNWEFEDIPLNYSPSEPMSQEEDHKILALAIQELPKKYRKAIQLTYGFNGQTRPLTDEESARVRGIPYKTQVTHKRRAIDLLRKNPRIVRHFSQ